MDMNEMINQALTSNPQFAAQLFQMMQQNGMIPFNQGNSRQPMNWNTPTYPMATIGYNYINPMNGQNNNMQPTQNLPQSSVIPIQQQEDGKSFSVRVIKSPDEIKPDEIPMNGEISLFLQDDLNVIYGKRWTNKGTVDTLRFILENNDQNETEKSCDSSKLPINTDAFFEKISVMFDEKLSRFNIPDKNTSDAARNVKKGVE